MKVFVDSNIPMYVAGSDHPHREPARKLLERVRTGEAEGVTSTEVLQEILYRYSAIGRKDWRARSMTCLSKSSPWMASRRDAAHSAVMLNHEIKWVATCDEGFSGIPGIRRMKCSR